MWTDSYFDNYMQVHKAIFARWPLAKESRPKRDLSGNHIGFRYACGIIGFVAEVTIYGDKWKLHMRKQSKINLTTVRLNRGFDDATKRVGV